MIWWISFGHSNYARQLVVFTILQFVLTFTQEIFPGSESGSSSSGSSSRIGDSSDESVKLEIKKSKPAFYATDTRDGSRAAPLPPTSANFKVAQLLETYLEEVAKDSSIAFALFLKLV